MKQTMEWIDSIAAQNKFVSGTGLPFAKLQTLVNAGSAGVLARSGVRSTPRLPWKTMAGYCSRYALNADGDVRAPSTLSTIFWS